MAFPSRLLQPALALALALAIGLGSAGCRTAQDWKTLSRPKSITLAADRVELPATFTGNYPLIAVRINGVGPFQLLLDSGSSSLMLSRPAAKRAGIDLTLPSTVRLDVSGDQSALKVSTARITRLEAGGLTLTDVTALISREEDLYPWNLGRAFKPGGQDYDGILGIHALSEVALEIDYPHRRVAVMRPGTEKLPQDRAVPYTLVGNKLFVVLDIAGRPSPAFLDTGDNGGFQISNLDDAPLLYPTQKVDGLAGCGMGGRLVRAERGQLDGSIRLGPITWENPPLFSRAGEGNVLGCDALGAWKVVFDQPARRLYLLGEPKSVFKTKQVPDLRFKPGFYGERADNGIRLLEVDSGDAFDRAGLKAGDVIFTVEGHAALDWIDGRIPPEIRQKANLRLQFERDGKVLETKVTQGPAGP